MISLRKCLYYFVEKVCNKQNDYGQELSMSTPPTCMNWWQYKTCSKPIALIGSEQVVSCISADVGAIRIEVVVYL